MTAPALVQKLWHCCNILRDDGLCYVEQIATGIVEDLRAALEQLAKTETDLKEGRLPGAVARKKGT